MRSNSVRTRVPTRGGRSGLPDRAPLGRSADNRVQRLLAANGLDVITEGELLVPPALVKLEQVTRQPLAKQLRDQLEVLAVQVTVFR